MKLRNGLMLLSALIFFACNNGAETTAKTGDTAVTEKHEEHEADQHEEHTGKLSLNNGAKWQTDESTRTHAVKLNADIGAFNAKADADISAFQSFAGDMQKELNSLVSDCKMKGPNHDALHLWLEPVLQDVSNLKKVTTIEEGKLGTEKLTNDVKKFNQYFN